MGFLTGYLVIGAVFGTSGYFGMRNAKHSQGKSLLAFFGLLLGWPLMLLVGMVMLVLFQDGMF
jgi:hypothetical protein